MLAIYLISLVVGGAFVGLSAFSGLGKGLDLEGDVDGDIGGDLDAELGEPELPEGDFSGAALGAEMPENLDLETAWDADFSGESGNSFLEAALFQSKREQAAPKKRRIRLPFSSFRFWTFGSCFFGLTGTSLHYLSNSSSTATLLYAIGMGTLAGTLTSSIVRRLREPVGEVSGQSFWIGHIGELIYPLSPNSLSKMRVQSPGRPSRELLAVLPEDASQTLNTNDKVVITGFINGRAVVSLAKAYMIDGFVRTMAEQNAADESALAFELSALEHLEEE